MVTIDTAWYGNIGEGGSQPWGSLSMSKIETEMYMFGCAKNGFINLDYVRYLMI